VGQAKRKSEGGRHGRVLGPRLMKAGKQRKLGGGLLVLGGGGGDRQGTGRLGWD